MTALDRVTRYCERRTGPDFISSLCPANGETVRLMLSDIRAVLALLTAGAAPDVTLLKAELAKRVAEVERLQRQLRERAEDDELPGAANGARG